MQNPIHYAILREILSDNFINLRIFAIVLNGNPSHLIPGLAGKIRLLIPFNGKVIDVRT